MKTLSVALKDNPYPILIGEGTIKTLADRAAFFGSGKKVALLSNETIAPLYFDKVKKSLAALNKELIEIILPDGEAFKDWQHLQQIYEALLKARAERGTTLIALGGGVIGDMGGFAAATYQRGIPFVQMPTSLLAQVDSSVGGKTAINHPLGKNMIGAFYQPKLVVIDTNFLNTLPEREFVSGLAEVIKYGLIRDLPFLEWLEAHLDKLLAREPAALSYAIERSCANKAEVVINDEKENGERAFLNLGHTFGHAIETGMGYGAYLHGEAVAIGTMMALTLSCRLGFLSTADVARAQALLLRAHLPVVAPSDKEGLPIARYLDLMAHDKKVKDGKLRLVLLEKLGKATLKDDVPLNLVEEAITACQSSLTL